MFCILTILKFLLEYFLSLTRIQLFKPMGQFARLHLLEKIRAQTQRTARVSTRITRIFISAVLISRMRSQVLIITLVIATLVAMGRSGAETFLLMLYAIFDAFRR